MNRFFVLLFSVGVLSGCSASSLRENPPVNDAQVAVRRPHTAVDVLQNFGGPGAPQYPRGGVVEAGGLFYGVARSSDGDGVLYSVSDTQAPKTLYTFESGSNDGFSPAADLVSVGGMLYGTTELGGKSRCGVVFSFDPKTARYKVVYDFDGPTDGCAPLAGLTYHDGVLYGTTTALGKNEKGTLFAVEPSGAGFKVVHQFGPRPDAFDVVAPLSFIDGKLWGVSRKGGEYGSPSDGSPEGLGTVFAFAIDGSGGVEVSVNGDNGLEPRFPVTSDTGRDKWLVNASFKYPAGRVLLIGPGWLREAHQFTNESLTPSSGMTFVKRHDAYGILTTVSGKPGGVVYIRDAGGFQVFSTFTDAVEGIDPRGTLLSFGRSLYGIAVRGGSHDRGTFWKVLEACC